MEGNSYFSLETLPACLTMIGDKINLLRCSKIRALVNAKLRNYEIGDVCVQFDVDEYDQIVASFFNDKEPVGDTLVIRSTTQKELIEIINNIYNKIFNKKEKTMKKKICEFKKVTSVNQTDSFKVEVLMEYILQHLRGAGLLYEADKMGGLNVSNLCSSATAGAVLNISFDDAAFTLHVASGDSIRCNVVGLNDKDLCKKVESRLQTAMVWYKESSSIDAASNQTLKEEIVAKETTPSKKSKQRSLTANEEVLRKETKVSQERNMDAEAVALKDKSPNALCKYNESVEQDINGLENELKNLSKRAYGQRIRGYLLKKARTSGVCVEDTSTEWLVSLLDAKKKELLCFLYDYHGHELPPFLTTMQAVMGN